MDTNIIYNIDCVAGMNQMIDEESIDLIIADPPYFKVIGEKWDYLWRTEEDYLEWSEKWIAEAARVLRMGGSFYLFGYFRMLSRLLPILEKYGFELRQQIVLNKEDYKIVLLSGPSSSGKTTTSMKLSLYLKSLGLNPTHLSIDDYFHEREETPIGVDGKPDFESLAAVDTKLFDNQVSKLLKGVKVKVPTFNFIEGRKEYKRVVELKENDILIIEGLHALNEDILTNIPKKKKFKVYISPLTYLGIDNDNRISMTDIRLLRRMIRDNRTRGYNPSKTLNSWRSVRDGEEKYVFPYQDNADVIFNSSLAYELAVLKTFAEPLLFTIKEDDPEYLTAKRLIELLKFVLPIPSETVPQISILREFIGGSYFE